MSLPVWRGHPGPSQGLMTSHPVPLTPTSCPTDITSCPHNITSCSTDITSCPSNITSCPPDATSCHMPSPRLPRPRADLTSCPCGRDPRELAAEAVEREAHGVEDVAGHALHQHRATRLDGVGPGLVPAGSGGRSDVTAGGGAGHGGEAGPGSGAWAVGRARRGGNDWGGVVGGAECGGRGCGRCLARWAGPHQPSPLSVYSRISSSESGENVTLVSSWKAVTSWAGPAGRVRW